MLPLILLGAAYLIGKTTNSKTFAKGGEVKISPKDYQHYLSKLTDNYGDKNRAKEELDWFISVINEINSKGGEVYRIVSVKDKSKINLKKLGFHWTFEKDNLSSLYQNLIIDDAGLKPFVITASAIKGTVDYESSLENFSQLPEEVEVNFTKQPTFKKAVVFKASFSKGGTTLLAPNGKPSKLTPEQYKLVRTPAFKEWFGDWENDGDNASKVVDEETKEPLVVYRGEVNHFEIIKNQSGLIFTTNNKDVAKYFGNFKEYFVNIKNPFMLIEGYNSWDSIDNNELIKNIGESSFLDIIKIEWGESFSSISDYWKYVEEIEHRNISIDSLSMYIKNNTINDGVIAFGIEETSSYIKSNDYIAFNSNQIKLADGSNTTFDGSSPDIRFEDGGEVGTIKIDGKEATREEFIQILREENFRIFLNPKKIEYNGDDEQIKESVSSYNRTTSPYTNGELKENYMKEMVQDAFSKLSFRKFGDVYRKNIDKNFSSEKNRICLTGGRTWQDFASYVIWDGSFSVEENEFRGFAKDLGITIPPNKS